MLDELKTGRRLVGVRQIGKALRRGELCELFLAEDADPMLTDPLRLLAEQARIPVRSCRSMQELGAACGISVGAAAAGLLKELDISGISGHNIK